MGTTSSGGGEDTTTALDCDANGRYCVITKVSDERWGVREFNAVLGNGNYYKKKS